MTKAERARIGPSWYVLLVMAVLAGFFLHEAAHWLMGRTLGYEMSMSIGRTWAMNDQPGPLHAQIISAAGPLFTIIVACVGAFFAISGRHVWGYALVFSSLMMRFSALIVSVFNLNDEARISVYMGLPWFVLPLLVVAGLLWLTVYVSRRLNIGWIPNILAYVLVSAVITVIVFLDGQLLVPAK